MRPFAVSTASTCYYYPYYYPVSTGRSAAVTVTVCCIDMDIRKIMTDVRINVLGDYATMPVGLRVLA